MLRKSYAEYTGLADRVEQVQHIQQDNFSAQLLRVVYDTLAIASVYGYLAESGQSVSSDCRPHLNDEGHHR